ncbi:MAG: exodeoxyribonuclease III [Succinivibrio sp.]|nr:exodeoxyribonuclease III [Succinivibrio sp.]
MSKTLKLVSWNVNGIRAASGKEGWAFYGQNDYDLLALQETKARVEQLPQSLTQKSGYSSFFCSSTVKKGYSGTAVYVKEDYAPLSCEQELPFDAQRGEGRIIHLEFEHFHFFNGYFPNGGEEILDERGRPTGTFKRVPYKMAFFEAFLGYAQKLRAQKPIVVCGDFNIAHRSIDLSRPKENEHTTGFLPQERAFLDRLVACGYLDTFRLVHGDEPERYSWWSYRMRARERNIGWRIDYFFVSDELRGAVTSADILDKVTGSDHCPISLTLKL